MKAKIGSFLLLAIILCGGLASQRAMAVHGIEADALRAIQESGSVWILGRDQEIAVNQYGITLEDGDEVLTGPDGKAHILLSMLAETDEVFVAPSSRIRVSSRVSDSLTSVYRIHVMYGKIRVRTLLNRAKHVRFDTDLAEITADEGDIIIESRKFGTSVGTIDGLAKMVHLRTGKEYQIPPKTMMFISPLKSVSPARVFVNELFSGVARSEEEKVSESYY